MESGMQDPADDRPGDQDYPEAFHRLIDYWRARHRDGRLPGRADIEPLDFTDLLPVICLIDVRYDNDGRPGYRYRLVGTRVVEAMGRDFTGLGFEEFIPTGQLAPVLEVYDRTVCEREPTISAGQVPVEHREFTGYRRLLLPLATDGETPDMIFACFDFYGELK